VREPVAPLQPTGSNVTAQLPSSAATPLYRDERFDQPLPQTTIRARPQEIAPESSSEETDDSNGDNSTAAGSDTESDDSEDSAVNDDHYPLAPVVNSNTRVLSVTPKNKLPAAVSQRVATVDNLLVTGQQHRAAVATSTKGLTEKQKLTLANPCQSIMVGNKTVDQSLGWRFREAVLANLKATVVTQDMASAAVGSKGSSQAKGGVGESILSVGSGSAVSSVGGEADYNIEPRFLNSQHLSSSLLIPADRQRQNTRSIFEVHQRDSHIWRLLIETKSPRGVRYYYEAWVKWKPVVGADAIQDRFHMLAVFRSQRPPLSLPAHCGPTITEKERRRTVREQIFARLCAVRTKNFPALVGSTWLSWFSIGRCTLNNLVAQKTHLRQLFEETPNATTLSIGDFILLFEYDPASATTTGSSEGKKNKNKKPGDSAVAVISSSSSSALMSKRGKEANERAYIRYWLRKLHYSPKLHFIFPDRCLVGVLTRAPYFLNWNDMRPSNSSQRHSFIKEYKDIGSWPAFFTPVELASLGFSFEAELENERQDFTLDIFRVMANGGHWDYEALFVHLDFTPGIIQQLGLTKADMTICLKWLPSAISPNTLELHDRGRCLGGELFTEEMYSELPGEEVEVGGILVGESDNSGGEKSPRKKRRKKDKKHKGRNDKERRKKKRKEDDDDGDGNE
jgi:hypothetical protein